MKADCPNWAKLISGENEENDRRLDKRQILEWILCWDWGKASSDGDPVLVGQWFSTKGFRTKKNGIQSCHFSQPRALVLGLVSGFSTMRVDLAIQEAMKFSVEIQATQHRITPRGPLAPCEILERTWSLKGCYSLNAPFCWLHVSVKQIFFLIPDSDWRAARSVIRSCGNSSPGFDTAVYPCCICTPARRRCGPGVAAEGQDHTPAGRPLPQVHSRVTAIVHQELLPDSFSLSTLLKYPNL